MFIAQTLGCYSQNILKYILMKILKRHEEKWSTFKCQLAENVRLWVSLGSELLLEGCPFLVSSSNSKNLILNFFFSQKFHKILKLPFRTDFQWKPILHKVVLYKYYTFLNLQK